MPDVFFSTNPSDYQKLEGLYVAERKPPGFIRGVDLNTVGLFGTCVRGPTTPQIITSSGQFESIYGTRNYGAVQGSGAVKGDVWAGLLNKPFGTVVVRRVAAAGATAGICNLPDVTPTNIAKVVPTSVGAWSADISAVTVEAASDANVNHFNVRVTYLGRDYVFQNVDCWAGNDNTAIVSGSDPAIPVKIVKLVDGRPLNHVGYAMTPGTDGSVAASDYSAALDDLAAFPGIALVTWCGVIPTPATFYSHLLTVAAATFDRNFVAWSNTSPSNTVNNEVTAEAADITTQSDRIWWAFNNVNTVDPTNKTFINQGPNLWLASILSQIDVDIHPGSYQTQAYLAGVASLDVASLSRGDLINLKNAGICALERLVDGFQFHSGVTTNLTSGLTEITRRRMADFLQLSAAARLRTYVKGKNTAQIRAQMAGELAAFSRQLQSQGRVVEDFEIDQVSVNNNTLRAQGEEHILWRVKLVGHMLELVFETEISTGTVIARAA